MGEEDMHVLNKDLNQIFKIIQSCCGKWRSLQIKHAKYSECQQKQPIALNQEALYLWSVFGIEFCFEEKMAQIKIFIVQNSTSEQ